MTLSPITAEPATRGCDSAAGTTAPLAEASRAPILTPRERYNAIAHRLGVPFREAECLWLLAQAEIVPGPVINEALGCMDVSGVRVFVFKLRRRGFTIHKVPHKMGYSLELADRERVLAAASVALPSALPSLGVSSLDFGGRECPPPFQPPGDLTRQAAE